MLLNSVGCQLCEIRSQVLDLSLDVVPERAVHRRRQVGDQRLRVALRRLRDQHRLTFCRKFEHRVHLLEKKYCHRFKVTSFKFNGQRLSTCLVTKRTWVQTPPGTVFFSSIIYPICSASLIRSLVEVQRY